MILFRNRKCFFLIGNSSHYSLINLMTLACTESCPPGWVLNEHYCYLVTKFHLYFVIILKSKIYFGEYTMDICRKSTMMKFVVRTILTLFQFTMLRKTTSSQVINAHWTKLYDDISDTDSINNFRFGTCRQLIGSTYKRNLDRNDNGQTWRCFK